MFVGYMRRYAAAFLRMKEEITKLRSIHYVTVRDIIGEVSDQERVPRVACQAGDRADLG